MLNSVRFRLTGWYVGVLCLMLIAFSMGVYSLVAQNVRSDADRQLLNAIDVLSRSLRHEVEEHNGQPEGEPSFQQVVLTVYRDSFPGIGISVFQGDRPVAAKPGADGMVPERGRTSPEAPRFDNLDRNGVSLRVLSQRLSVPNAGSYHFTAAALQRPVEEELARLRRIFYLTVPLALGIAAIVGFLLARKSLAPVVAMSQTASGISSKDLSQRIPVGNPKDELGKLAGTFNQLLDRLEEAFSTQRQFMEDSSHELRTPIYVAHTAAQVTLDREGRTESEYREALTTIDQQLSRLQHIVEDMFVLARADAGVYPLQIADYDLGEVVSECIRAAALLGGRRGVTVRGPDSTELPARGDDGLVRQLILILLDNAVKHAPPGGAVDVSIDQSDPSCYSILVRDTGAGIPEDARGRIFERFYRVDKARSRGGPQAGSGAGLGLSIAQWIASVHGGAVELDQTGPGGSTFRATITRRREAPALGGD